jgi:vibriolysin
MKIQLLSSKFAAFFAVALAACASSPVPGDPAVTPGGEDSGDVVAPMDVAEALAALPRAEVLQRSREGIPTYLAGELATVEHANLGEVAAAERELHRRLAAAMAPFRIDAADLRVRKSHLDERGTRHLRVGLVVDGLEVIGGDMVVHVDRGGTVTGINGGGRGDLQALPAPAISPSAAVALALADPRFASLDAAAPRLVYLITAEGTRFRAYELFVTGQRGEEPVRDAVYVDTASGKVVADYPQYQFAKSRKIYSAGNGSTLPGTLKRSEGQPATADSDVNAAYDNTGLTYDAYFNFWGRDSFNNAGGALISSVHFMSNYCNAFWNGSQMVYGDGSGTGCLPLARSLDVTAHELTHGVTANESGLVSSGETGGINESISDIFGAFTEAWFDGGKNGALVTSAGTWLVGEDVITPVIRNMCDPAADGSSADFWSSTIGNLGVYPASGVGNLAFCLLSKGGTHPRGKSTLNVPGIGMDKAIRILYKAQVDILTSTAKYAAVRTAMEQATTALGYDQATKDAVSCAWAAVNVGTAPTSCGASQPPPTDPALTSGAPVTAISGAANSQRFWQLAVPAGKVSVTFSLSGGTGDADLYVRAGAKPTLSTWECRPFLTGNAETCTVNNPAATTYWVMLHGFAAYSGATLVGTVR